MSTKNIAKKSSKTTVPKYAGLKNVLITSAIYQFALPFVMFFISTSGEARGGFDLATGIFFALIFFGLIIMAMAFALSTLIGLPIYAKYNRTQGPLRTMLLISYGFAVVYLLGGIFFMIATYAASGGQY